MNPTKQRSTTRDPAQRTALVSVVMGAFNEQSVIDRSIQSIVDQTLDDWELIIVNDGSTDQTAERLNRWSKADRRIRVIHHPNRGLTRSLIDGCAASSAKFIARQDADDWSAPDRLAAQVELLQHRPEIGLVSCYTDCVGPAGEVLETIERPTDPDVATERLLHDRLGPPAHGSLMFRKDLYDAVGGYREAFYYGQDADLWMRMAQEAKITYVDQRLYTFCRRVESISAVQHHLQRQFGMLGQACKDSRLAGESEQPYLDKAEALSQALRSSRASSATRRAASSARYLIGAQLLRIGNPASRDYLWDAIRAYPLNGRAWVRWFQSLTTRRGKTST